MKRKIIPRKECKIDAKSFHKLVEIKIKRNLNL